jgi:hypothetical protein
MHRILVSIAIAVPLGALVLGALVALGMTLAGESPWISTLMGAGIGVLAGLFFGVWAGFVASIDEFDAADLHVLPDPED